MTGICFDCGREIEVVDADDVLKARLQTHGRWKDSASRCIGSGGGFRRVPKTTAPKLPGVGKRGTAPCGHEGEHVTATMVACPRGCEVLAPAPKPSLYECRHPVTITFDGTKSCRDCGKVFKR